MKQLYEWVEKPCGNAWDYETEELKICIHCHMNYPGDRILSCQDVGIEKKVLFSKDIELAKEEAIAKVKMKLKKMLKSLEVEG